MTFNLKPRTLNWRAAILALLSSTLAAHAQVQQAWAVHYNNGITNGQHRALKMALDGVGNIYICGFSQNANGGTGYATLKYAPNGQQLWAARFDSTNFPAAQPTGLALDAQTNALVTGNAVTLKYDRSGDLVWSIPSNALAIACDRSNNVIITGLNSNFVTAQLSPTGSNLWMQTYTSYGQCTSETVNVDASGDAYVCGGRIFAPFPQHDRTSPVIFKYGPGGNVLWSLTPDVQSDSVVEINGAALDSAANLYFIFTMVGGDNAISYNTFAYSAAGASLWAAYDPTHGIDSAVLGLAVDTGTNIVVTGKNEYYYPYSTYGTYAISNGTYLWGDSYPAGIPRTVSGGLALATDSNGRAYVTGYSPTSATSNDIVTIAYGTNGKQLWLQRYDGPAHGDDEGNAICVDTNGNVYVAGYDTPVGGGAEMVLIKYSPVIAQHEANGNFQLEAQGAANEPFDIRATTNLSTWQDLGLFDADTNGLLQFTDTNASQYNSRFYLAIPQ